MALRGPPGPGRLSPTALRLVGTVSGQVLLAARPAGPILASDRWMRTYPLGVRLATIGAPPRATAFAGLTTSSVAKCGSSWLSVVLACSWVATAAEGRDQHVHDIKRSVSMWLIQLIIGFLRLGPSLIDGSDEVGDTHALQVLGRVLIDLV